MIRSESVTLETGNGFAIKGLASHDESSLGRYGKVERAISVSVFGYNGSLITRHD